MYIYLYTHKHTCMYIQILPQYYQHLDGNRASFICKILALFRIQPNKSYFMLTMNAYSFNKEMHQVGIYVCVCDIYYVFFIVCM